MLKLFSAFRKNKIWDFNGGIHPPEMKTQLLACGYIEIL